jgi:hypothetical protein
VIDRLAVTVLVLVIDRLIVIVTENDRLIVMGIVIVRLIVRVSVMVIDRLTMHVISLGRSLASSCQRILTSAGARQRMSAHLGC